MKIRFGKRVIDPDSSQSLEQPGMSKVILDPGSLDAALTRADATAGIDVGWSAVRTVSRDAGQRRCHQSMMTLNQQKQPP